MNYTMNGVVMLQGNGYWRVDALGERVGLDFLQTPSALFLQTDFGEGLVQSIVDDLNNMPTMDSDAREPCPMCKCPTADHKPHHDDSGCSHAIALDRAVRQEAEDEGN